MKYLTEVFLQEYGISIWNVTLYGGAITGRQPLMLGSFRCARTVLSQKGQEPLACALPTLPLYGGKYAIIAKEASASS